MSLVRNDLCENFGTFHVKIRETKRIAKRDTTHSHSIYSMSRPAGPELGSRGKALRRDWGGVSLLLFVPRQV
jgi:hypothetical protein